MNILKTVICALLLVAGLMSKEMEWQKEGTTYSAGTWGSDYRHFVRGK